MTKKTAAAAKRPAARPATQAAPASPTTAAAKRPAARPASPAAPASPTTAAALAASEGRPRAVVGRLGDFPILEHLLPLLAVPAELRDCPHYFYRTSRASCARVFKSIAEAPSPEHLDQPIADLLAVDTRLLSLLCDDKPALRPRARPAVSGEHVPPVLRSSRSGRLAPGA
jgi:hypothetical protein